LTDDDLKALDVGALGDRKRLLAAIADFDRSAPATSDRTTAPLAYTPHRLAERILGSRGAVEGERKHVTVLFADVKGSTSLIDNLDPEEAAVRLNPALSAMMEAVHRYEGMVNKVQGDGIMALFGAPLAHEDHAVRACLAALAILDHFKDGLEVRVGAQRSRAPVMRDMRTLAPISKTDTCVHQKPIPGRNGDEVHQGSGVILCFQSAELSGRPVNACSVTSAL
jgi:hypothetical protein